MTARIDLPPYPDSWYYVASSADVEPGRVTTVRYFGRDLVCWRGESGEVSVLDAYCGHLGAHIGYGGFVEGDNIVCPFHHWRWNREGRNERIPYRDKPQRAARIECFPVLERNGQILVWHSSTQSPPDWEPPAIDAASDPDWLRIESERWEIDTHVQEIFENTVDIAHFQFVHGVAGFGAVELVEQGPMFRAIASVTMKTPRGPVDGAVESELWGMGLDFVRQRGLGEARAIFSITPIEESRLRAFFTFFVPKDPETGEPSRYGSGFMREFSRQITQDIPIWEHKRYRERPMLAMGEGPIVDYRRWTQQFYAPAAA
jgi:phenylpropionate dioxygenase-like ring-hydroxylating dioxygenase large terminal subunit